MGTEIGQFLPLGKRDIGHRDLITGNGKRVSKMGMG